MCEYLFTGRQYDPETEIYWYRARYYMPTLGRFLGRDPRLYLSGQNMYEFCDSRCSNCVDPLGLTPGDCFSTGKFSTEKTWHLIDTVPGDNTYVPGPTSAGNSQGAVTGYIQVWINRFYEEFICCDCNDSGFFWWGLGANTGTASYTLTGGLPVAGISNAIPIPLGAGQAVDITALGIGSIGKFGFLPGMVPPKPSASVGVTPADQQPTNLPSGYVGNYSWSGKPIGFRLSSINTCKGKPAAAARPAPAFTPIP